MSELFETDSVSQQTLPRVVHMEFPRGPVGAPAICEVNLKALSKHVHGGLTGWSREQIGGWGKKKGGGILCNKHVDTKCM